MSIEQPIGRLGALSASELADKAARAIFNAPRPRAVCIDDVGNVTVEGPDHAIVEELIGVYTPDTLHLTLSRRIYSDLRAAIDERRIMPGARRARVESGRRSKRAA